MHFVDGNFLLNTVSIRTRELRILDTMHAQLAAVKSKYFRHDSHELSPGGQITRITLTMRVCKSVASIKAAAGLLIAFLFSYAFFEKPRKANPLPGGTRMASTHVLPLAIDRHS